MAIKKFKVEVTQTLEVLLDDEKINDEFNEEFKKYFWDADSLSDHAKHLAQMETRGLIGHDKFVEGYGDLRELNCSVKFINQDEELVSS